jgi:hypothetical protein
MTINRATKLKAKGNWKIEYSLIIKRDRAAKASAGKSGSGFKQL